MEKTTITSMNTEALKNVLYAEHEREKKISIRNYIIVAVLALIGLILVFIFFSDSIQKFVANLSADEHTPWYLKVALPAIFLSILIYPTTILYASLKRANVIEKTLALLHEGNVADNFHDEEVYKTTIPLGKIKIRYNPFHYLHFTMDGKLFKLPVPKMVIPEVIAIMSGANMEKVNSIRDELYEGKKQPKKIVEDVPIKTPEEFKAYASTTLNEKVNVMEGGRKKSVKYFVISAIFIALALGTFIFINSKKSAEDASLIDKGPDGIEQYQAAQTSRTKYILIGFGILVVASMGYTFYQKKKYAGVKIVDDGSDFTSFKTKIFKEMIHFINPGFEYIKSGHVSLPEIMETKMFVNKNYAISGNDLIVGRHLGVPFQYCDLSLGYKQNFSKENESPDQVFSGQFFTAKFNKHFTQPLYVFSKSSIKGIFTNNAIHSYLNTSLPKVLLEDPEFAKDFDVYCNDQVMARYILSTSLMQRIKELSVQEKKATLFISFNNDKVCVLNNTMKDKFETGFFTKIKPELLEDFYTDLCRQFNIIEELKLNVNIWNTA